MIRGMISDQPRKCLTWVRYFAMYVMQILVLVPSPLCFIPKNAWIISET